jgi:hypothetical protein
MNADPYASKRGEGRVSAGHYLWHPCGHGQVLNIQAGYSQINSGQVQPALCGNLVPEHLAPLVMRV